MQVFRTSHCVLLQSDLFLPDGVDWNDLCDYPLGRVILGESVGNVIESFFNPFFDDIIGELEKLNYQTGSVYTVDTTGPHGASGEAHCASNVRRELP